MTDTSEVNSVKYWDGRFLFDWEQKGGRAQSRFFAQIAVDNFPKWLHRAIVNENLSIVDWGCALGDGTAVLKQWFKSSHVTGVDFSSEGINLAKKTYPETIFVAEDWLVEEPVLIEYDIVFCSNTLEHFDDPFNVMEKLGGRATSFVIAIVPFQEHTRIKEHFYTFLPENIATVIGKTFQLVWARSIDCAQMENTYWNGEQIILIYAKRYTGMHEPLTFEQTLHLSSSLDYGSDLQGIILDLAKRLAVECRKNEVLRQKYEQLHSEHLPQAASAKFRIYLKSIYSFLKNRMG